MLIKLPTNSIKEIQDWCCLAFKNRHKIIYASNNFRIKKKDIYYYNLIEKLPEDSNIKVTFTFDSDKFIGAILDNESNIFLNYPKNYQDNDLLYQRIRSNIVHEMTHILQIKLSDSNLKFGFRSKYKTEDSQEYLNSEIEFYPQLNGHLNNFSYLTNNLPDKIFKIIFNYSINNLNDKQFYSQINQSCDAYLHHPHVRDLFYLSSKAENYFYHQGPDINITDNILGPIISARDFFIAIGDQHKYYKAVKLFYKHLYFT